jgi:hypothetical protein
MRDFVSRYDVCSLGLIALVAYVFVQHVERHFPQYQQAMRVFMVVGFLAAAGYGYVDAQPAVERELFGLVAVAFIASQVAGLVALLVVPPFRAARDTLRGWRLEWRIATERRAEERRKAEEKRRKELEWEQSRPERERQEREWEARRRAEAAAQKRRDDVRAECLLYFQLHAPEMSGRFGREQFDEYLRLYMGDGKPPEEVERRAQRLIGLMDGHLEKSGAKGSKMDVAALAKWYQETKAQIEALPVDERAKRVQVAQLTARYTELVQQHLEELKP